MRRPDVDRMMASMTAREYKEWEAYERAVGPLDSSYEREILCEIHELLQVGNLLAGRPQRRGQKNAAGKFRKVLRPDELFDPPEGWDEEDDDDDDELDDERPKKPSGDSSYDPSKDPFADHN